MIGILIQVRMKSQRLLHKALRPLFGQPLILRLSERLESTNLPVIWCTSAFKEDAILSDYAKSYGYECFKGAPENIAQRFIDCMDFYGFDRIVRVTGDNPLTCPEMIKKMVQTDGGYVYTEGLCSGLRPEVISRKYLKEIVNLEDQEHNFTGWLKKRGGVCLQEITSSHRLTIDTEDDYRRMVKIYDYYKGTPPSGRDIIKKPFWIPLLDHGPTPSSENLRRLGCRKSL